VASVDPFIDSAEEGRERIVVTVAPAWRYRRDPLGYVEHAVRSQGPLFRLPDDGTLCVADPDVATRVLRDEDGCYDQISDFFHTRGGRLEPRAAQMRVGRAARHLLWTHVTRNGDRLPELVAGLGAHSVWPAAGRVVVHRFLAEILLRADSSPRTREAMAQVVRHNVLIRSHHRTARIAQRMLRARVVAEVAEEVRIRRGNSETGVPSHDLLDAVIGAVSPETTETDIAEVYLLLFRTAVAPVGHVVGWTLLLAEAEGVELAEVSAEWAVRESLRLWPVAWLFVRPVHRAHDLGGVWVEPGDSVAVCAYLLHRDERYWPRATRFRPERWADQPRHGTYVPFGGGPFVCAGASVAQRLAAMVLRSVVDRACLSVRGGSGRPGVEGIITPPRFHLHRTPHPALVTL